jgi:hypothetical protein
MVYDLGDRGCRIGTEFAGPVANRWLLESGLVLLISMQIVCVHGWMDVWVDARR